MCNMLDVMEMSIKSDSVSYNEFLLRYNPKKKQVFAFYEGDEDSSYYRKFLEDYLSGEYDIEEIIAGCKNNVLKLHKEFDWENYDSKKISFFVDRDLSFWLEDESITENNIFVTSGYSVENYLISKKIFRELLFNIKGFARAKNSEIIDMCKYFDELLPKFKEEIKKIMAMAVLAKRRNRDIKLSEYKISNNLKFDIVGKEVIFQLMEDNSMREKWGIVDITDEEISIQISKFNMYKNEYSVRGKWIVYFMVELSEFMRKNFTFFSPSLATDEERVKLKPTCNIESTKATPVLAPRCTITEELKNFINKNYIIYRDKEGGEMTC